MLELPFTSIPLTNHANDVHATFRDLKPSNILLVKDTVAANDTSDNSTTASTTTTTTALAAWSEQTSWQVKLSGKMQLNTTYIKVRCSVAAKQQPCLTP